MSVPMPSHRPPVPEAGRQLWHAETPVEPEPLDPEWLLRLAQKLQSTLQLEGLIEVFARECSPLVPFDGLEYQHAERGVEVHYGDRSRHSCTYTLLLSQQLLGELTYTREHPFSERDAIRLESLTSYLVYPLRNAFLYRDALVAASKDPLTGAHNRATLESTLDREVRLARRHGSALSVVMLDLDRFKGVNDRYGHAVGDRVLRTFAASVSRCIRGSDVLFRYGGEEFVVVLRNTDLRGAALLAERIRLAIEQQKVECEGHLIQLTVSAGVATMAPREEVLSLVQRADKALYHAKANGRNRVTAAA